MTRLPISARWGTAAALFLALGGGPASAQPLTDKPLSLDEALQRGLQFNLGVLDVRQTLRQAEGQRRVSRAALLPNVLTDLTETRQQVNLAAMGVRFESPIPGFSLPGVVGPFNTFDLRARVSQTLFDAGALHSYRAASESVRAREHSAADARDIVVQAVGGAYLQVLAASARVDAARAQLDTANALLEQAQQRRTVGLAAQVDVDRSRVQVLQQQQQLIALQNDFAKLKIDLARMIGAPPTDRYTLADSLPFTPGPDLDAGAALREAHERRADLQAARSQVNAAAREISAARAGYLPSARLNADYGVLGPNPSDARRTFSIVGTVRVPIWQGGSVAGRVQQADAELARRQAALDDLERQIDAEVHKALLDLSSLAAQVNVAERNLAVTRETLELTRQRFDAGITDNVEVVQAQESVSNAAFDHINSVFAHNIAKLNLARALGQSEARLREFLGR